MGFGATRFGCFAVELAGCLNVFFAAEAALVQPAEAVGCIGYIGVCNTVLLKGTCIPFAGAAVVGLFCKFVQAAEGFLCFWVTEFGGTAVIFFGFGEVLFGAFAVLAGIAETEPAVGTGREIGRASCRERV